MDTQHQWQKADLLYKDRLLVDYTDKELSIWPREDWPFFSVHVLPMLYGEKMAGRIEAAADRKAETLVIKNIWYESGIRQTKKLNAAVDAAVRRLAKFNDCSQVRQRQTGVCEEH